MLTYPRNLCKITAFFWKPLKVLINRAKRVYVKRALQKRVVWGYLLCVLASSYSLADAPALPNITTPNSKLISLEEEHNLGLLVAGQMNRRINAQAYYKTSLTQDFIARLWLQQVIQPLINHSQLSNKILQIFIVNDDSINAFAAPGSVLGVNYGLIKNIADVDEFIAVMAHEIIHISERHYAHRRASADDQAPIYFAALMAALLLTTNSDNETTNDIIQASILATSTAMLGTEMSYSRRNEKDADRKGMQLMAASGYDESKMVNMLRHLHSPINQHDPKWQWARSHPISANRIADISARLAPKTLSQPHDENNLYQLTYQLLRISLAVALTDPTQINLENKATKIYQQLFPTKKLSPVNSQKPLYQDFFKAEIFIRTGKLNQAESLLAKLAEQWPHQLIIWNRWMDTLQRQNKFNQVIAHSQDRLKLGLDETAALLQGALAYKALNKNVKALTWLNRVLTKHPQWALGWQLKAEWAAQIKRTTEYYIAKARWHLLRTEFTEAQAQITQAQKQSSLTLLQTKTLNNLLQRIQDLKNTQSRLNG